MRTTAFRGSLLAAAALVAVAAPSALAGSGSGPSAGSKPASSAGSPAAALHVVPFPGTPDAAPATPVIFSSLPPAELRSVTVTGSRTGSHGGQIAQLPDGAGTEFKPDHPFTPGEAVTVSALLNSAAAGTASGAPGATQLNFSFKVALPALEASTASTEPAATTSRAPTMHFRSQQNFHPPVVHFGVNPDQGSGAFFLTPNNSPQVGNMILNSHGKLVWFRRARHSALFNLEVQRYLGLPVLTWWHGNVVNGHGANGEDVIMGRSYRKLADLHAANGYSSDLHEFQITSRNTALIDAYVPVHYNLRSVGGPSNGTVLDGVIQELDIKTGQLLWEWHALGHVPLSASHLRPSGSQPFDYFHINSIQQQPNHNLLISARNTWAVYMIGQTKGSVIWTLGGRNSRFKMGAGTGFEWQHDARQIGQTVSVFDDAAAPQEEAQSSAKRLFINRSANTATLEHAFVHSPPLLAGSQGNAQTLSHNNMLIGWGSQPVFSEASSAGRQIFSASFPLGVTTYRAYRFHWSGQPLTPPSLGITPQPGGALKVYASWNGATQVAKWRVLGGPSSGARAWFDTGRLTGFETVLKLHSQPRYLAVQGVDGKGHVLGISRAHGVKRHLSIFGSSSYVSTSTGYAGVPVGCIADHGCSITVRINWGHVFLGQSSGGRLAPRAGALLYVHLSSRGISALRRARNHRLRVHVTVRDSSGISTGTHLSLVPYSTSGSGPARSESQSRTVQLIGNTEFVRSSGSGGILSGCYAQAPCHIRATLTSGGTTIATTSPKHLGADELGYVPFQLNSTGQAMLSHASGNQLAAQVRLTNGSAAATGQIALARHG